MPSEDLRPRRRYDFSGGLNLGTADLALAENELVVCENFDIGTGALVKRGGMMRYNNSEITGLAD